MATYRLPERVKNGWNAFMNKDPTLGYSVGASYSSRPDRVRLTRGNERSIITSIFNRIAIDVEQIGFKHCQLDDNGRFESEKFPVVPVNITIAIVHIAIHTAKILLFIIVSPFTLFRMDI